MIFVTVGTQLPFPRLLDMAAQALEESGQRIFAQTADPEYSGPFESKPDLSRAEFAHKCEQASLILGHAGMGTILAARRHATPLIVVPRRHHLGEHRNDHQFATAAQLGAAGFAGVATTLAELQSLLAAPPSVDRAAAGREKARLIGRLQSLIATYTA